MVSGDWECSSVRGELGFARAAHRGVQRGEAPLPRVWGCPPATESIPQEWGIKGVETGFESASQTEGQHTSRECSGTVPVGVTLSEYA